MAEAMQYLADQGMLSKDRILEGLPHPSGANAERISYFLGKKSKNELSAKTNPIKIDQARSNITARVSALH